MNNEILHVLLLSLALTMTIVALLSAIWIAVTNRNVSAMKVALITMSAGGIAFVIIKAVFAAGSL